jgi:hypothetical protein
MLSPAQSATHRVVAHATTSATEPRVERNCSATVTFARLPLPRDPTDESSAWMRWVLTEEDSIFSADSSDPSKSAYSASPARRSFNYFGSTRGVLKVKLREGWSVAAALAKCSIGDRTPHAV